MRVQKTIDGKDYILETWLSSSGEIYKFGIQAIPRSDQPQSFSVKLSEEFIEDEIDNEKRPEYLEHVALRMAENHIRDMFTSSKHSAIGNIKWWFKEAKAQIDKESQLCLRNEL